MADPVPQKKVPAKKKVFVEAVKRAGFPGFYCLGRLFPNGVPVEIEVTTEDVIKTRKSVDVVTDEVTVEDYIWRESELKQLLRHTHFLKVYEGGSTPMGTEEVVKDKTPELTSAQQKAIDIANREAAGEGGADKGPTGRIV